MAVLPASPPAANLEVLLAHVPEIETVRGGVAALLPHKIYNLGIPDLVAGRGLGGVRFTGWRYVLRSGDDELRVVEIAQDVATERHSFVAINSGSHVDQFVATHRTIGAATYAADKDYEIAVLRSPACYVMAAWAGGVGHDGNLLIPLAPVHSNFEAGREYDAVSFVTTLETTAREMARRPAPLGGDGLATDGGQ